MLFLKIYVGFSLFTFVLLLMQSYLIKKDLIRKYPDAMNKYAKNNKKNILEKICSYTKSFVSCFVPIVNIGIFYVSLFDSDKVNERILKELEHYRHDEPIIDAKEVVHAKWKRTENNMFYWYECSHCKHKPLRNEYKEDFYSSYCPYCGATMDLEDE